MIVFSLKIGFDPDDLIALGRLMVLFLLIIFAPHALSLVLRKSNSILENFNERWAQNERAELEKSEKEIENQLRTSLRA